MAKNYFAKIGITILAAIQLVAVGWYIHHDIAQAYVRYGPAAQLNVGDITSAMIKDATIASADMANYNSLLLASSTVSNLTTTNSVSLPAGSITSTFILDGTIANADISASAAIAPSKIATTSTVFFVNNSEQTITGVKTFTNFPVLPAGDPTNGNEATNKSYVDAGAGATKMKLTAGQNLRQHDPVIVATSTFAQVDSAAYTSASNKNIGRTVASQMKTAQGVKFATPILLNTIKEKIYKVASPTDDIIITILTDSAGEPSSSIVATSTIVNADISGSAATTTAYFYPAVWLEGGKTYWIQTERSGAANDTNYYRVVTTADSSSIYANGQLAEWTGAVWSTACLCDSNFELDDLGIDQDKLYMITASAVSNASTTLGLIDNTYATNTLATVSVGGAVTGFTGLTTGAVYMLSDTVRVLSATAGTVAKTIGMAVASTTLLLKALPL